MRYLGEDVFLSASDQGSIEKRYFEFNTSKEDYFLTYRPTWDKVVTDVYYFNIGTKTFKIPHGSFIFICDEYGQSEWILIEESIGRKMSAFVMDKELQNWSSREMVLVDVKQETIYLPITKNVIPVVSDDSDKVILISMVDQYLKTKNKGIEIYLV